MDTVYYAYAVALGLIFGSFLNVLIYRLPRNKEIVFARSACPDCSHQIAWYHNIPLLGYIWLRGKCAHCRKPISIRYPLVEAANAAMYCFFYWRFGASIDTIVFSALGSALIVIFLIDAEFQIIPDSITLPGTVVGLGVSFVPAGITPVQSLIGILVGGGVLYLIALAGDFLFKKESMGGGDIKMAAMLGAFLGWQKVVLIFMTSAVVGLVVSLVMMAFSQVLRKERLIPFGPFLSIAAVIAVAYGDQIIRYYVDNFLTRH
jgi:leader peptidase (prepilin peptidase)/N-methyltransferase